MAGTEKYFMSSGVLTKRPISGEIDDMHALSTHALSADVARVQPTRVFAEAFFRHRVIFTSVFLSVLLLTLLVTIVSKNRFSSETKFLLENTRSNAVITADRNSTATVEQVTEQQVNSELEILGSDDVIGSVADPGWKLLKPSEQTGDALKAHELRLAKFRKNLKIQPGRKSNIITVSYSALSPEEATGTLARLSNAYLSHRKLLSRPNGTFTFFNEEANRYRDIWEKANNQMTDFQKEHQVVSVPQKEEMLSKTIAADEEDLRGNQAEISEMDGRLHASAVAENEVPKRHQTVSRVVSGQTSTEQLRALLVQLQNKRAELLTRFQPTDRLVAEVDKQIGNTAASLNALMAQRGVEDTTDVNPAWQQVQSSQVENRIEKNALSAKSAKLSENIADLRGQLKDLESLEVPFNALEEAVDQARSNFELFSEKRDQAQIEDAMDERKIINVGIAESPTSTYHPSSPRPVFNAAIGLLSAMFLAAGAVYMAEMARNTFATPHELESFSQFPVLATVPVASRRMERNHRRMGSQVLPILAADASHPATIRVPAMQNFDSPNHA
ncbi:MAG: hypothetical protein ABSE96_12270 [Terracidiphilus sp.]|jgi:uncharacterized protein involved in exopolysaccharide biosynthesis